MALSGIGLPFVITHMVILQQAVFMFTTNILALAFRNTNLNQIDFSSTNKYSFSVVGGISCHQTVIKPGNRQQTCT